MSGHSKSLLANCGQLTAEWTGIGAQSDSAHLMYPANGPYEVQQYTTVGILFADWTC